jgi:hypothetical protein
VAKAKKKDTKTCASCGKDKKIETSFYSTQSKMFPDKRLNLCKVCISNMVDVSSVDSVKNLLRQIDKPFIASLWNSCTRDYPDNPLGNFLRVTSSLPQYRGMTWADSSFDMTEIQSTQAVQKETKKNQVSEKLIQNEVSPELFDKWGRAFSPQEILDFEATYQRLRKNYKVQSAQHEEFLRQACIYQVKGNYALAANNTKDAKDYNDMFIKATAAGKLQPQQLSKSDLSDGLETFGALVRRVEEAQDIIPIMPQFRAGPRDLPDVVIHAFVNYIRNLKGLGEVEYEEIYRWYDKRRENYEKSMTASVSSIDETQEDEETEDDEYALE